MKRKWIWIPIVCALYPCAACRAQMVTGADMPGFTDVFRVPPGGKNPAYDVREVAVRTPSGEGANVLWPGEAARFTFRITNKTAVPIRTNARFDLVAYGTRVSVGDIWTPHVFKIADEGSVTVRVDLPGKGSADLTVIPHVPERFGGYALVADLGTLGRAFAAALVRVPKPDLGRVQFPTYALDLPWPFQMSEAVAVLFQKLGVKGCRMGAGYYPTTAPDFRQRIEEFEQHLKWAWKHQITVLLTVGEGGAPMPLGRPRPWLSPDDVMLDTKSDYAWLPEFDGDFERWSALIAGTYGWPKGPVNAMELWNEPWEGISISGWGADMIRYRDLYTRMALGIEEARRTAGVRVLIGGACSSTNTRDKLFCDGSDRFLKWLDFVSIHYQPLAADPALEKKWVNRKSPYGPVRVWDTESWIANSEDRVAAVIASMRAQGQTRTAGIYHGNVYTPEVLTDRPREGIVQAWSPAAAVAATQKFLGQRPFERILFRNGLPWVFVFGSRPAPDGAPLPVRTRNSRHFGERDDGTVVVLGDLGAIYDRNRTLFRQITGLQNVPDVDAARRALAALPPDAGDERRRVLQAALDAAAVVRGASLTLGDGGGQFVLYDFYGNPVPAHGGKIVVPLNGQGYFLRTRGAPGSFGRLIAAIEKGRIEGYVPVEIVAHDLLARIEEHPMLHITLTNILNRPVHGELDVRLEGLKLDGTKQHLALAPHETREVHMAVVGGHPTPTNTYHVNARFDAGKDGVAAHAEDLHVNVVSRRSIVVDGDLSDWRGVLPQPMSAALGRSLTEEAYLPFLQAKSAASSGAAVIWLAYDDQFFYFAARIADDTPYEGNIRFATRNDDAYFYPETVYEDRAKTRALHWPAGVRRFSYRKDPDLPSGNGTDNVQIAFNVLPADRKTWLPYPRGTMPHFMTYQDTDYEFAFNQVAPQYGGGFEIWRLLAPGMPRKHFYPRQPKAPVDGGPVSNGKLVMRREGNTRIVEAALPWSELRDVKSCIDAGLPVKFTCRINDNGGPALELAAERSVSKAGTPTFHNDWTTHWANELEFSFER
ncbi:MAG: hypothetical protein ACP5VE_11455 [Chthonomonadales bacterium]